MKKFTSIILNIIHTLIVLINILGLPYIACSNHSNEYKLQLIKTYIVINVIIMVQWILLDGQCSLTLLQNYCDDQSWTTPIVNIEPFIFYGAAIILTVIAICLHYYYKKRITLSM